MASAGMIEPWIGRHFIVGLRPGPVLGDEDRDLLRRLKPAGVILYKANFDHDADYEGWTERLKALLSDVFDATGDDGILVGIDHEGGRVCRTPPPMTRFSYPARWAETAGEVGRAMGRELASIGVNLNFAPLLDIASNPDNPVIGERAFSSDPQTVAEHAIAFMRAQEGEGVLACGKHFPGHGDTRADSHYELPVLDIDAAGLAARELIPFRTAIEAGLGCIMTSHILFPQIDASVPATLSRPIINGLLREALGFDGLVMTDDLNMHAMDRYLDDPDAARACLNSGTDMLMVCSHLNDNRRALIFADAIGEARRAGAVPDALIEASQARIATCLTKAPRNRVHTLTEAAFTNHQKAGALFDGRTVEVT
ncbi:MAG: glycoside hydrolase family 3 protein [Pseudomonadota bacterium]